MNKTLTKVPGHNIEINKHIYKICIKMLEIKKIKSICFKINVDAIIMLIISHKKTHGHLVKTTNWAPGL